MEKRPLLFAGALLAVVALFTAWWLWRDPGPDTRPVPTPAAQTDFNRNTNGLWATRGWLHGGRTDADRVALAADLEARGITRFYPFLGPPNAQGVPGWRDQGTIRPYRADVAGPALRHLDQIAPRVQVIPWTGGVLKKDIVLDDADGQSRFVAELKKVVDLGADGVHINVEPLPSGTREYLALLKAIKTEIGPDKILSVAAYPPTTSLHPFKEVHWSLAFTAEVCTVADEIAVMGYDTALKQGKQYVGLMADWTADLMKTLPPPADGGCTWLMGVPGYEDEGVGYHDPSVETLRNGITGVIEGLRRAEVRGNFQGIVLYASWTLDASEWTTYDRLWRRRAPVGGVAPDGRGWSPPPTDADQRTKAAAHTKKAIAAYTDGKVKLAVVELKMATQIDPKYGEAWCMVTVFSLPEVNEDAADKCIALAPNTNPHRQAVEKMRSARPAPSGLP